MIANKHKMINFKASERLTEEKYFNLGYSKDYLKLNFHG